MRAVVVTNDPDGLTEVRRAWSRDGIETEILTEVASARRVLRDDKAELVVLDCTLSPGDAVQLYSTLRKRENAISMPIVFRCPDIKPPWWAVRDYFIPPEAGIGPLLALGQEILRSNQPDNGTPVDYDRPWVVPGPDRDGSNQNRPTTFASLVRLPPRETWQSRVRAARGHNHRLRAAGAEPERSSPAKVPLLERGGHATTDSDMSLPRFLLRWSWVLMLMIALGLVGGYAFLLYGPLKYQSTALLMMPPQMDPNGQPTVVSNPTRIGIAAQALAGLADSPHVHEAVRRALAGRLDVSMEDIALLVSTGRISITPVGTSGFISIVASDTDPDTAWLLADGYARGVLLALDEQTRVVTSQQRTELQTRIEVLKSQLAAVPSGAAVNAGADDMYVAGQRGVFESLIDAQTKLRMLSQAQAPLTMYGETSAPVQALNERRVLVAGAAVGGASGVALAYLLELLRQWLKQRRQRTSALVVRT